MNPFEFGVEGDAAYRRWRQWKLDLAPRHAEDLVVGVADPLNLQASEVDALAARCRIANMAFYAGPAALGEKHGEDHSMPQKTSMKDRIQVGFWRGVMGALALGAGSAAPKGRVAEHR